MKRLALSILLVLSALFFQTPVPTYAAENQDEILFYLADDRLIILKFQVLVDQQPYRDAWNTFLDERFKKIDKNQDGEIAGQERDALPSQTLLARLRTQPETQNRPTLPATMNREAFGEYLEQIGFRPFRVDVQSPPNQSNIRVSFAGMQQNPDQAAKLLFGHLDADADGRLSREEMENALTALHKQDLDQDETISSAELIPVNFPNYFVSPARMTSNQQNQTAFLSLSAGTSARQTVSRLMAKYDTKEKDNALSREELGLAEKLFADHDVDANGKWDFEETQQFLQSPSADVTATVRFGKRDKDQPFIAFEHGEELDSDVQNAIGSLNLGIVQMEITATANRTSDPGENLQQRFESADADNNGYLEQTESQRLGMPNQLFTELDRDKDGKLFPEEVVSVLVPIAETMTRQISLTITDGGRDLFRILDSSGDSRISRREFWAMANRAALWDRDDDGQIAQTEIPQQYRLATSWGNSNVLRGLVSRDVVLSNPGSPAVRRTAAGPTWFQRMDRNGDGDISSREFLGSPNDFQQLDQDADGLISADEASLPMTR